MIDNRFENQKTYTLHLIYIKYAANWGKKKKISPKKFTQEFTLN